MPDDTEHEAAHAAMNDPTRGALARQWALNDHLSDPEPTGHGLDRWGDLPSDPAARERLHDSLPHPDPLPLLTAVENAHSQLEHASPDGHADIAATLLAAVWAHLAADERPAVTLAAVGLAGSLLSNALDRLAQANPAAYPDVLRRTVAAMAERLPDGDTDPRDD